MIRRKPSRARSVASIVPAPRRPLVKASLPRSTAREASSRIAGGCPGGISAISRRIALAPTSRTATGRAGGCSRSPATGGVGLAVAGSRRRSLGPGSFILALPAGRARLRACGDIAVTPDTLPEERSAALLRERVRRVFQELPGALAGNEEPVHQLRVAARRLRIALRLLVRRDERSRQLQPGPAGPAPADARGRPRARPRRPRRPPGGSPGRRSRCPTSSRGRSWVGSEPPGRAAEDGSPRPSWTSTSTACAGGCAGCSSGPGRSRARCSLGSSPSAKPSRRRSCADSAAWAIAISRTPSTRCAAGSAGCATRPRSRTRSAARTAAPPCCGSGSRRRSARSTTATCWRSGSTSRREPPRREATRRSPGRPGPRGVS